MLDLADGDTLSCPECDETFTVADVEALVASWSKLLPFLCSHPARQQQPACVRAAG
jgi:hypothetical protein